MYCNPHYFRVRRNGHPGSAVISDRKRSACDVDDCTRAVDAEGLCITHLRRKRKGGSVDFLTPRKKGAENHAWRGDQVGYTSAHQRVYRARGKARALRCACGRKASHWAYQHTDPKELRTPEGLPYSADPEHYAAMCVSCHKLMDLALKV